MGEKPVFRKIISFEEAKQLLERMRRHIGYPSGYRDLDNLSGGLAEGGVTLIASRPAMGRTSLVLNIVNRMAQQEEGTILIFSPQMHTDEIIIRLLSIALDLESKRFLDNSISCEDLMDKWVHFYNSRKSRIKIDRDTFLSLDDIWERCCRIPDLRLIVIDPIEAVCQPVDYSAEPIYWGKNKEKPEVIFPSLQKLADNLGVPLLCTACLHRSLEEREDKRPCLDDLNTIGIPTEAVDQVIFLYRDRYYAPDGEEGAQWIVAKAEQGNVGTIWMDWDYDTCRFTERGNNEG